MLIIPIPIKAMDNQSPRVMAGKSVRIPRIAIIAPTIINITLLIIFLSSYIYKLIKPITITTIPRTNSAAACHCGILNNTLDHFSLGNTPKPKNPNISSIKPTIIVLY